MIQTNLSSLEFKQHEITLTGPNNRGCLAVYPVGKKSKQKIAAGDISGVAIVFQTGKHHDVKMEFQTPPAQKPVDRLTLFDDQLFMVNGTKVSAFTKKGKGFFSFEMNITETVKVFKISTPFVFAGGEYTFTTFREVEEAGFFMSPDKVNDMIILTRGQVDEQDPKLDSFECYLGCNDRVLRSVHNTKIHNEAGCEAPIISLTAAVSATDPKKKDVVYGTSAGSFGSFAINAQFELVRKYSVIPQQRTTAISGMASCDINQDGVPDILIGREDGTVEVFTFGRNSSSDEPQKIWSDNVGEYVNTISNGYVTNVDSEDVVVHTYGGKIVSFAARSTDAPTVQKIVPSVLQSRPADLPSASDQIRGVAQQRGDGDPSAIEITHSKVVETQSEIDRLRAMLAEKTRNYATSTGASDDGNMRAIASEFRVRDSLTLQPNSDVLKLHIETDCSLDMVGLQCDRWLEVSTDESKSDHTVMVSVGNGKFSNTNSSAFHAVLRNTTDNANKVSLLFRTTEGLPATLVAHVIPRAAPRTAQLRTLSIKPLALHHRISESDAAFSELPLSTLKVSGAYSVKDAHSWILKCLPDVPDVIQTDVGALFFRNALIGTVVAIRYSKNEIECSSDNISTITIFKEHVTREATARTIPIKILTEPSDDSVVRHLKLLHPLLSYQVQLVERLKLLEAIKEIEGQENDANFLPAEYREISANAAKMEEEFKVQPKRVEYLKQMYEQLYRHRCVCFGKSVSERGLATLQSVLEAYSLSSMLDMFAREK